MTVSAVIILICAGVLMTLGLALSYHLLCLAALSVLLTMLYCAASVLWAKRAMAVSLETDSGEVLRGAAVDMVLRMGRVPLLPVGPLTAVCETSEGVQVHTLQPRPLRGGRHSWTLSAPHVGTYPMEVREATLTDCFGILKVRLRTAPARRMLVLPRPFSIAKLSFAQSEDAMTALRRANEDPSLPDDVRSWQPGDPMKRVHWKLTARKRELLVRRYETPMPRDTLILTDCAVMPEQPARDREALLRDALCETVVAVAEMQLHDGSPVRVPLYGENPTEFSAERAQSLLALQELLAEQPFRSEEPFARVLSQELKRVRRSGAVVIVSPRLDPMLTDLALSFRRMGPNVRYYVITFDAENPVWLPYIRRMQEAQVEVCYVTPAA